jgi:hypothetical protein
MTYQTIMTVIALHWIADFVLQSDWQAKNKSKDNFALLMHVGTYTACLAAYGFILLPLDARAVELWVVTNGSAHFAVDYVTSRINTHLWNQGRVHDFFVMVGLDQLIHYACLFGTLCYMGVQ